MNENSAASSTTTGRSAAEPYFRSNRCVLDGLIAVMVVLWLGSSIELFWSGPWLGSFIGFCIVSLCVCMVAVILVDLRRQPREHTTFYHYGRDGRLVSSIDPDGVRTTYAYDRVGRLTSATTSDGSAAVLPPSHSPGFATSGL